MITVTINGAEDVQRMIRELPKTGGRAAEIALDRTAKDIKAGEVKEMKRVFEHPVRYTLNSLKITPTKNHNMQAKVWFKEPDRMGDHYLVPQVEGGPRKLKGFERALDDQMFIPGKFARMTRAGNVSPGQLRQILSVLGRAERYAGYSANITSRSRKRNRTPRDYVYIRRRHGRLLPGIHERFATRRGLTRKARQAARAKDGSKVYQRGRSRHRAIHARGLRPVLLIGRQHAPVKPRFDFYGVAERIHSRRFDVHFWIAMDRMLSR